MRFLHDGMVSAVLELRVLLLRTRGENFFF